MIGVGSDVFKGLVRVGNQPQPQHQQPPQPAQQARERAKTSAKTDDKWTRPAPPEKLQAMMMKRIKDGNQAKASAGQAKYVAQLFGELFVDDLDGEDKYHACLEYLTGESSATDLTKVGASALINNLREEPESKENYNLHESALAEMNAVLEAVGSS